MVYSKDYDKHFNSKWDNVHVNEVKTTPAVGFIKGNDERSYSLSIWTTKCKRYSNDLSIATLMKRGGEIMKRKIGCIFTYILVML